MAPDKKKKDNPWDDFETVDRNRGRKKATPFTYVLMVVFMALVGGGIGAFAGFRLFLETTYYDDEAAYESKGLVGAVVIGGALGVIGGIMTVMRFLREKDK